MTAIQSFTIGDIALTLNTGQDLEVVGISRGQWECVGKMTLKDRADLKAVEIDLEPGARTDFTFIFLSPKTTHGCELVFRKGKLKMEIAQQDVLERPLTKRVQRIQLAGKITLDEEIDVEWRWDGALGPDDLATTFAAEVKIEAGETPCLMLFGSGPQGAKTLQSLTVHGRRGGVKATTEVPMLMTFQREDGESQAQFAGRISLTRSVSSIALDAEIPPGHPNARFTSLFEATEGDTFAAVGNAEMAQTVN